MRRLLAALLATGLASSAGGVLVPHALAQRLPSAPGAPGVRAIWAPADKHGFGTAHQRASHVWFTLRQHELSEVYYPDLGTPALRELQFAVGSGGELAAESDGARGRVRRGAGLTFTQTTTDRGDRWRLSKTYVTDPRRATVLARVRLTSLDGRPHPLYLLADPALSNDGDDDRAVTRDGALLSWDRRAALAIRAQPALLDGTSGYAGSREPWRRLQRAVARRAVEAAGPRAPVAIRRTDAPQAGNVTQLARTQLDGRP
ncbi:hypothetical protein VSS74_28235, partial [Conexibacter stalactiti]